MAREIIVLNNVDKLSNLRLLSKDCLSGAHFRILMSYVRVT